MQSVLYVLPCCFSLSQPKIRAALAARSRNCAVLLTGSGSGAVAAASAAQAVACASPLFVRSPNSLCVAISTSPGFDCNVIAFALAFVAPPLRLGSSQLQRLDHESTVFGFKPRRRAASRAPSSMARTRTASRSTGGCSVIACYFSFCSVLVFLTLGFLDKIISRRSSIWDCGFCQF
jgi:hypothetical protein